jgi:hypothetical protein
MKNSAQASQLARSPLFEVVDGKVATRRTQERELSHSELLRMRVGKGRRLT